ncbi:hypothetical protein [Paraburkholderia sp. EG304]|uniref:hypothetical protein n=1 Tax=Paraburkholderia sp. EG304 TaxID=3237015 RepID=UPI00397CB762
MHSILDRLDYVAFSRPSFAAGRGALSGEHRKRTNGYHPRRLRNSIPRSTHHRWLPVAHRLRHCTQRFADPRGLLQVPARRGPCVTDHRRPFRIATRAVDETCGRMKQRRLR